MVIGNSAYPADRALQNPVNDANDMAAALEELGFEVIKVLNGNLRQMKDGLNRFDDQLRKGVVGVLYYSGHGHQYKGENYVIPVDAELQSPTALESEAIPVRKILRRMEHSGSSLNVVILDACRDTPFAEKWRSSYRGDGVNEDLTIVETIPESLIAYATSPGGLAEDGTGRNSTFTGHLLRHIRTRRLDIALMLRRVRSGVKDETGGEQIPWTASSITTEFSFNPRSTSSSSPPPVEQSPPPIPQQNPPPRPQQNLISYANPNISLQRNLTGHSNSVTSVAISPDGRTLVSGSSDNTIKVWDLVTFREKATLTGHSDWVLSVAISPDGRTLVSGSYDNTIKVWDLATLRGKVTLRGFSDDVFSVAISPDGRTFVTGSVDSTIKVWDLATRSPRVKATLRGHSNSVRSVAISPDSGTIVSGSDDNTIKVWDLATLREKATLTGHSNSVRSVAISPDSGTIISGSYDNTIKVWDLATLREKATLTGHSNSVRSVAISSDSGTIVSGSYDNTIKVWDLATLREKATLTGHSNSVRSVAISPGETIVSGGQDKTIKVWEANP